VAKRHGKQRNTCKECGGRQCLHGSKKADAQFAWAALFESTTDEEFVKSNALHSFPFNRHINLIQPLLHRDVAPAPVFVYCSLLKNVIFRYATLALNLAGVGLRAKSAVFAFDTAEEVSKLLKTEDSSAPNMCIHGQAHVSREIFDSLLQPV
jgi:hypothetical protein